MADNDSSHVIIDDETVSQWVQELSETPFLKLSNDGEVYLGVASELDRTVDTEPLDRLKITGDKKYPPIISLDEINGKKKLIVSIDSNLIPQFIDSLRKKAKNIERKVRRTIFWLLIISSLTFVLESVYNINFPDFLTPLRLIAFWVTLFLYVISDRIVLQGVAYGKPASIWGCTECANLQIEQARADKVSESSCDECGDTMIPLVQGGPGSVTTRGTQFKHMLEQELRSKRRASDGGKEGEQGIDKAKKDIDSFYRDENSIALYCLALEDRGLEWSDEDQEAIGGPDSFEIHKTWGTRGEEGSDTTLIANSLKDTMLASAIVLRADQKEKTSVNDQLDILERIIESLPLEES